MTGPTAFRTSTEPRCWQCGALASPNRSYSVLLVADCHRQLEAFGYPVIRGRRLDKLRLSVPRCARCQSRTQISGVIVLCGAFAGAVIASVFWPHIEPPSWLHWNTEGIIGIPTAIGLVIGLVVTMIGVAKKRRALRLRSVTDYPPVNTLRQAGWDFPSS